MGGWNRGRPWSQEYKNKLREIHKTHGFSKRPEYKSYLAAKGRCCNPKDKSYKNYGGRGIEFRFTSFEEFFAEVGERPSTAHSLDRSNNDGHYERGNLKWSLSSEQHRNQRRRSVIQNFSDVELLTEIKRRGLI